MMYLVLVEQIHVNEVVIEGADIAKALCDYVAANLIENIVTGASSRNSFVRYTILDFPSAIHHLYLNLCYLGWAYKSFGTEDSRQ